MPAVQPAIAISAILFATGTTLIAASIGRNQDLRSIGAVIALGAMIVLSTHLIIRCVQQTNRPADQAFLDGYEVGYDKGWCEATTAGHPNVVSIVRSENFHAVDRGSSQR